MVRGTLSYTLPLILSFTRSHMDKVGVTFGNELNNIGLEQYFFLFCIWFSTVYGRYGRGCQSNIISGVFRLS